MKTLLRSLMVFPLLIVLAGIDGCKKTDDPSKVQAQTHYVQVSWFRDASTPNPAAFIDLYNGNAYTQANAQTHAGSIDLFTFDRSQLPSSATEVDLVNMTNFVNPSINFAYDKFNTVVGVGTFSAYNTSTLSDVTMTAVEFNNIMYNADIEALFSGKGLNGGYGDWAISSTDLNNIGKYYQFVCSANGKKGFFHVTTTNYLPGGTMTLEVKVEQ